MSSSTGYDAVHEAMRSTKPVVALRHSGSHEENRCGDATPLEVFPLRQAKALTILLQAKVDLVAELRWMAPRHPRSPHTATMDRDKTGLGDIGSW